MPIEDVNRSSREIWSRIGVLILLSVLVIFGLFTRIINSFAGTSPTTQDFLGTVHRFVIGFEGIFLEALPFMLVGSLAAGVVDRYYTEDEVQSFFSDNKWKTIGVGLAAGILIPLGDVGGIILGRMLLRKGASLPAAAALMISAASANLVSLGAAIGSRPILIGFGFRAAIGIIFAVMFALFLTSESRVAALVNRDSLFLPSSVKNSDIHAPKAIIPSLGISMVQNMLVFMPFIIAGALVSGIIQVIPAESWLPPFKGSIISQWTSASLWGILTSRGNVGDLLAAGSWNLTGLSSQALIFLLAGAFCDIKTIGLLLKVLKFRTVLYLTVLALGITMMSTLVFGLVRGSF